MAGGSISSRCVLTAEGSDNRHGGVPCTQNAKLAMRSNISQLASGLCLLRPAGCVQTQSASMAAAHQGKPWAHSRAQSTA